jgi:hypothetical protein
MVGREAMMGMMGIDGYVLPGFSKFVSRAPDKSLASACFIPINTHHTHHRGGRNRPAGRRCPQCVWSEWATQQPQAGTRPQA